MSPPRPDETGTSQNSSYRDTRSRSLQRMVRRRLDLFFCLSEPLSETVPVLDYGQGPEEEYRIAELVVADSRAKAKWMAYKADKPNRHERMEDMPKMSVRKIASGFVTTPRVVSREPAWQQFWGMTHEVA